MGRPKETRASVGEVSEKKEVRRTQCELGFGSA